MFLFKTWRLEITHKHTFWTENPWVFPPPALRGERGCSGHLRVAGCCLERQLFPLGCCSQPGTIRKTDDLKQLCAPSASFYFISLQEKNIFRGVSLFGSEILLDRSQLEFFRLVTSEGWKQQGSLRSAVGGGWAHWNSSCTARILFQHITAVERKLEMVLLEIDFAIGARWRWRGGCPEGIWSGGWKSQKAPGCGGSVTPSRGVLQEILVCGTWGIHH